MGQENKETAEYIAALYEYHDKKLATICLHVGVPTLVVDKRRLEINGRGSEAKYNVFTERFRQAKNSVLIAALEKAGWYFYSQHNIKGKRMLVYSKTNAKMG